MLNISTPGLLSPVVRKIAREHNINLKQVKGTGAADRITKADVESYVRSGLWQSRPWGTRTRSIVGADRPLNEDGRSAGDQSEVAK